MGSERISWDDDLGPIQLSMNLERIEHYGSNPFYKLHNWLLREPSFVSFEDERSNELKSTGWSRSAYVKMAKAIGDSYMSEEIGKGIKLEKSNGSKTREPLKPGDKV